MNIAILDDYQDRVRHLDCFSLLAEHDVKIFTNSARGIGQQAIRLANFEVLLLNRARTVLSKALIDRLPKLKLIVQIGEIGTHIDMAAASARGITVIEGREDPVAPAELTWALIMATSRKIPQYADLLKQGVWQACSLSAQHNTLGRSLRGQTLGIWGYGRIGRLVASYAQAFGMRVRVWGSEASRERAVKEGCEAAASKQAIFSEVEVLSLHLRLSEATRGIISAEDLTSMKRDALFVNTSHAELIQPGALEAALQQGHPGSAAIDVFESEPLLPSSSLLQKENVLATPHLGYVERNNYEHDYGIAFQHIIEYLSGVASGR